MTPQPLTRNSDRVITVVRPMWISQASWPGGRDSTGSPKYGAGQLRREATGSPDHASDLVEYRVAIPLGKSRRGCERAPVRHHPIFESALTFVPRAISSSDGR